MWSHAHPIPALANGGVVHNAFVSCREGRGKRKLNTDAKSGKKKNRGDGGRWVSWR